MKYTIADYQQWQGDWELWKGVAVAMTPSPFYSHQRLLTKLIVQIETSLQTANSSAESVGECDWNIDESTVVRPDIAIMHGPITTKFIESAPIVVIEILSPSTAEKDKTEKFELYRSQRVQHYLIVDPKQQELIAYRLTSNGEYESQQDVALEIDTTTTINLDPATLFS